MTDRFKEEVLKLKPAIAADGAKMGEDAETVHTVKPETLFLLSETIISMTRNNFV